MLKNAKIISILNNKGGVLKTSSLLNIASVLAKKNKRILLVDADGQANTSFSFDIFSQQQYFDSKDVNNPSVEDLKLSLYDLLKINVKTTPIPKIPLNDNFSLKNINANNAAIAGKVEDKTEP